MRIVAFDVDETLACSDGPIAHSVLKVLHDSGDMVGLCGNWALALRKWPTLRYVVTFLGPMEMSKAAFLIQLSNYIEADAYVMVGNIQGVSGQSDDQGAARIAGWDFVQEKDWKKLISEEIRILTGLGG